MATPGVVITIITIIVLIYWYQRTQYSTKREVFARDSYIANVYSLPNYLGIMIPLKIGWNSVNMPAGSIKFQAKKWYSIEDNQVYRIRIESVSHVRRCGDETGYVSPVDYIFDDIPNMRQNGFDWITFLHVYLEPDEHGQLGPYIRGLSAAYANNNLLPYGNPSSFILK